MCGIAGAIGPLTPPLIDAVRVMSERQRHRGPDAEGFWRSPGDRAAFGSRRLAIIDLSEDGRQPMTDPDTGNVITFNGEIYNYRLLKDELSRLGERFRTSSDTEVILKAYRRWGDDGVARLRGMFAFAIWDARGGTILLARDRVGIKPLYWASVPVDGGRAAVIFASELRSLLGTDLVGRRIDPAGLCSYLWNGFVLGEGTFIAGINQLPAGTTARIDPENPRIEPRRYWSPPGPPARPAIDPEAVRTCFAETVRQHLISDVPVGIFLSGGVDSSAVTVMAVQSGAGRIRTFNIAFDEAQFDESSYARRVAEQLGTEHHELRLTQRMFADQLPDALGSIDQPTVDSINTYFVSRIVRESGIKVALAGTGGDELFGGYKSFRELPWVHRAARACSLVPAGLVRAAANTASRLHTGAPGDVPPQTRWGKLSDALTSRESLLDLYQIAYALFTRDFLAQLSPHSTSNGTPMRSGLPAAWAAQLERWISGHSALGAVSILELSCYLGERLLRDTDAASMAVSLEVRVPFLDHELIESLSALDDRIRFGPVGSKRLLRRIALQGLDPAIFDRPKAGFVLPFELWCRESLRDDVAATFADRRLCESVGVSSEALTRLLRAFLAGAPGLYWSRIWSLYVLLWWAGRYRVSR